MSPGVEKIVTLTSQCDFPIEIYSLDFNVEYLKEEEILNTINIYDNNGIYRTGVRNTGDNLPSTILTNYKRILLDKEREKKKLELYEKEILEGSGNGNGNGNGNENENENNSSGGIGIGTIGEMKSIDKNDSIYSVENILDNEKNILLTTPPIRIQIAARDNNLHQDFIIFGLSLTGRTEISKKLSKKLHLIMRNIDEIIQEVGVTDSDMGIILRKCLNISVEREKIDYNIELEKLLLLSEDSKKSQLESVKKEKKKSRDLHVELPITLETRQYEKYLKNSILNSDNLSKIIAYRLTWSDVGQGLIIDGFHSSYLKEKDCVHALKGEFLIFNYFLFLFYRFCALWIYFDFLIFLIVEA